MNCENCRLTEVRTLVRTLDEILELAKEERFDEITEDDMKRVEELFELLFDSLFEPIQKQLINLLEAFNPLFEFMEKIQSYKE